MDELRKKQAKEKEYVKRLRRVKEFFKKNSRRFLVAGIVVVIFSSLALTHGIGYTATVSTTSSQIYSRSSLLRLYL